MPPEKKVEIRVWPVLRAYGRAAGRHPRLLSLAVLGAIGVQAAGVAAPLYLRRFVNELTTSGGAPGAIHGLFITLGLFGLINLGGWVGRRVSEFSVQYMEAKAMTGLYAEAFEKLLRHSHEFFISNFTGTLTRRVTRYARSFEQVSDNAFYNFLPAFLYAAGIIGVLSLQSAELGGILLAWTVGFVIVQFWTATWLQPLRAARTAADSAVTGTLSDAVLNHSTITTFAALPREKELFGEAVAEWYRRTTRSWRADEWVNGIQGLLAVSIEVGLLAAAVYFWQRGVVTIGDFVLIQIYILGLMDRIWGIGRNMRQLYDAFADASEMLDIIDLPLAIKDALGARPLVVHEGGVVFDHVHFEYHDDQAVLADLDLAIAPHEKVALVGPSGAGKSTITKLLLRLYDVTGGAIRIDGQDIAAVTQESLREAISFVPQEPALFHRTLRENITYGRPDASEAQIIEAAMRAHCHEFISALPQGYDTYVGERGVKLSGGERQRVAIARAILKDAPILILDEATSSLDSESEALIQEALVELMQGKTVIAIAHRLSTVMKMDRIIVMEAGRVVLTGTHGELLSQGSNLYQKLWDIQAGGFIRAED